MATSSQAKTLLGGIPSDLKSAFARFSEYIFDRNLAFGPVSTTDAQTATANFAGRYLRVTTSDTANQEVAIAHGLGRAPNVMWQVVTPRIVNSRFVGDLTVSRAADDMRIYLTSASTSAVLHLYVE
jgi:hypothetical protein